jgi:hypothetical protein
LNSALHKRNTSRGALASCAVGEDGQRIRSAAEGGDFSARWFGVVLGVICTLLLAPVPRSLADRPSAEDTFGVYQQVSSWLRDQSLPKREAPREERAIDPENCAGTAIVLRLSGRVIGRGEHVGEGGMSVWFAATDAWEEASPKLTDGLPNDALYEDRLEERLDRMTIDIQLAGPLVPLPAETFSSAAALINPGRQGAAARSGGVFGAVFPGTILSFPSGVDAGFDPSERALRVATTRLGLPPVDLDILRRSDEVALYRFDVRHLAQTKPGVPPTFLTRGGRLVSEAAVTGTNLRAAADEAAEFLIGLEWPGEEPFGMLGDYLATADRYEPYIAPPRQQATVAFALNRYASIDGTAPARAQHASAYAANLLTDLTRVAGDEVDPRTDPVALATWLLAWAHLEDTPGGLDPSQTDALRDFAASALTLLITEDATASFGQLGPGALALRAFALAKAGDQLDTEDADKALSLAREDVRRLFRELPAPQLVTAMPWLGWAELELASGEDSVPAAVGLREMRDIIWDFQVDPISAGAQDADFVGGIVFSRGSTQLPTWQSLRPIAFVATMLGDSRLTDREEVLVEILPLTRAMRFVMQLSASEAEAHMYPEPERAIGGLRLAVWDQTISVDATSLGLVAICEMLDSLSERSGR